MQTKQNLSINLKLAPIFNWKKAKNIYTYAIKSLILTFFWLIMHPSIAAYIEQISTAQITPEQAFDQHLEKAKQLNPSLNALVRFFKKNQKSDALLDLPLKGLPLIIKDNILIKGEIASCGSNMLKDFIAPYSATVIEKLAAAGAQFLASANMDEFAMGGSNETSAFGPAKNPHGIDRIPGGSSGGSAVAVAADMAIAALGTDTWGSVRQPASMCGIVGFKPTYGAISRYGVVAMASSLDQVGIFTKTVADAQFLFSFIAGHDPKDANSSPKAEEIKKIQKSDSTRTFKFFIPEEALNEGLDPQIKTLFLQKLDQLRTLGHQIDIKPLPLLSDALAIYYTLMPSEVSTNLSRFDGIRFWHQGNTHDFANLDKYYAQIRAEGFWEEVQRRILLWTYILNSANYESYYLKALQAQQKLKSDFSELFTHYDAILTPTSPEAAWKIGEKSWDPVKSYLADLYTVPANLAELPAISVPMWEVLCEKEKLPIGIQIMGAMRSDQNVFEMAKIIEIL